MTYTLPDLPYAFDTLEPVISSKIMQLHHDKHHAAYVTGANAALDKLTEARTGNAAIDYKAVMRDLSFHVNGHLLHSIFWQNMRAPQKDNTPGKEVLEHVTKHFTGWEAFKHEFGQAAKSVEGGGWAIWAVGPNKESVVYQIEKQNLMHMANFTPILTLDVWEHAYYLDYLNDRGAYVDAWWQVVNWDDVSERLTCAECECHDKHCENCKKKGL